MSDTFQPTDEWAEMQQNMAGFAAFAEAMRRKRQDEESEEGS